eukprot:TRINITY_DN10564_c0_g1_i1.p1 TRINITY_DN10564_c0_g1~~TRINITY_DN10564_c0_g1_i1.p1  ORF type:complete len:422 (-),score=61.48 TRINITY_DN10564_c0_g1_i1:206-1471(-)
MEAAHAVSNVADGCGICNKRFDSQHAYNVHMKSMTHRYAVEREATARQHRESGGADYQATQREVGASVRKATSNLRDRALPIMDTFHNRMYALIAEKKKKEEEEESSGRESGEPVSQDLTESILNHYKYSRPSANVQKRRKCLFMLVKRIVNEFYPSAKLEIYGSIPLLLDAENSDIDVSIYSSINQEELLVGIADAIDSCNSPHIQITRILTARIPLLTFTDRLSNLQLDLSIWFNDKREINRVLAAYMKMDKRLRPFIKAIRVWAKARKINDSYTGTINSFAWTVMAIAFCIMELILPPIPEDLDELENSTFTTTNTKDEGQLLIGFMEWCLAFDYDTKRVSLRCGGITDKEAEKFEDDTVFVIERPRTPYQNMTRQMTVFTVKRVRYEWHRAVEMLRSGKLLRDISDDSVPTSATTKP